MRIRNDNEATVRLYDDRFMPEGYSVHFNETDHDGYNVANVRKEVGQELAAASDLPTISEYVPDHVDNPTESSGQ